MKTTNVNGCSDRSGSARTKREPQGPDLTFREVLPPVAILLGGVPLLTVLILRLIRYVKASGL